MIYDVHHSVWFGLRPTELCQSVSADQAPVFAKGHVWPECRSTFQRSWPPRPFFNNPSAKKNGRINPTVILLRDDAEGAA